MGSPPSRRPRAVAALLGAILAVVLSLLLQPAPPPETRPVAARPAEKPPAAPEAPAHDPLADLDVSGDRYVSRRDGMVLVRVPGGEFTMGSDDGAFEERPAHRVRVGPFLMDRTEVTNAQFARFLEASGYEPQGPWRRGAGPGKNGHPVRYVTWHDAAAYARWAGRALPTEAQWEFAARGPDALRYPWGNRYHPGGARVERSVADGPAQVGSFPAGASPFGCLDMAGNVWEWTADWYDRRAYEHRSGVTAEPRVPEDGAWPEKRFMETGTGAGNERSTRKVIKGGGWVAGGAENCRASKRTWANPRYWLPDTGFRCVVPLHDEGI